MKTADTGVRGAANGEKIAKPTTGAHADLKLVLASYHPISARRIGRILTETDAAALMQAGAFGPIEEKLGAGWQSRLRDELARLASEPADVDALAPDEAVQLTRLAVVLLHADAAWRKTPVELVCPSHREIDELASLQTEAEYVRRDSAAAFANAYHDALQTAVAATPNGGLASAVWSERVDEITGNAAIKEALALGDRIEREEQEREAAKRESEQREREREREQREREQRDLRERGEAAKGNALARVRREAKRLRRLVGRDSPEAAELARVRDAAKGALAAASTGAPAGDLAAWSTREVSSMQSVSDEIIAQLRGIADPVLTLANARDRAVPRPVRAIATATHRAAKRRADRSVESIPERHSRKRDEIWSATYWAYASAHARMLTLSDAQLAGHMAAYRHDVNWGTRKWRDIRSTVDIIAAGNAPDTTDVLYIHG